MTTSSCIPLLFPGLAVTEMLATDTKLFIAIQSTDASADCPKCNAKSSRHHSSYLRQVQDTPLGLFTVRLQLKVRRFRCGNQNCQQQTFAEQFPALIRCRRQRTNRVTHNLTQIGLALGGEAGAKLAGNLGLTASPSTLLRLLHQIESPKVTDPRIIGIDDWAFRKGRDYGTLIVDHETGKAIDLLPDRDCETVKQWLKKHPTVEIVTRDRSGEYREAITQALPDAVQIADRWHLLKNLRETIQRHISRRHKAVAQIVTRSINDKELVDPNIATKQRRYDQGPGQEALHNARTEKREALFKAVKARYAEGAYTTDLAKEFALARQTISKWVNSETLPPDTRGRFKQKCLIDDYVPYLRQRIEAGCHNQSQLWREICEQGFGGERTLVARWVRQNYHTQNQAMKILPRPKSDKVAPCSRELSWLLIRRSDELEDDEKRLVDALIQDDKLAELRQLAHEFMTMIRNGSSEQWLSWLKSSCESVVKELKNFALALKKDSSAIYAALRYPWSNGPTEGHVNRLKFIKRQMYGRASFNLLRLRVLLMD